MPTSAAQMLLARMLLLVGHEESAEKGLTNGREYY